MLKGKELLRKSLKKIIIFLIAFTFLLFPFKSDLNALSEAGSNSGKYDYVLIIDESGSMRTNDPANLRVDAARLFIYLSEILNEGNRLLIAGFGEKTNIYLPLTEISENEDDINDAIRMIKSNQQYTDMKGALLEVKKILEQRTDKQNTAVIFLTDGALTLDDIPPEDTEAENDKDEREKPGRAKTEDDDREENPSSIIDGQDETDNDDKDSGSDKTGNTGKGQLTYLEKYKQELLDLCYSYKQSDIVIYPIAFTQEAEIELLEQMASITSGACWRAEKAADIRNIFLEILKNITSRFLRIEEQTDASSISGEFEITKDVKELVLIATASDFASNPGINIISAAGGGESSYDRVIEEKGFKIVQVDSPEEGKWSYNINGDGVFVYDMVSSDIIEPDHPIYLSGTDIPFKIKFGDTLEESQSINSGDFKITCEVEDPEGIDTDNVKLSDDGKIKDEKANDGIFSGIFNKADIKGNYSAVFSIRHVPTDSASTKKINFEVIELPVVFEVIEPLEPLYTYGTKIAVKAQLSKDPDIAGSGDIDFNEYQLTCAVYYPDGRITEGLMLLDNGQAFDETGGDGIFSAGITDTSVNGYFTIRFYILHTPSMNAAADTASMVKFRVSEIPEMEESSQTSTAAEPEPATAATDADTGKLDSSADNFPWYLKLTVIGASVIAAIAIFLFVYFLYIKPKRNKF